jgi:methylmalonyl-CoA carboxyltransferase 12S subunit
MRNAQIEIADMVGQVDALRHALEMQIEELRARQAEIADQLKSVQHSVAALEAKAVVAGPLPVPKSDTAKPQAAPAMQEGIPDDIMVVISAAVAAFVGKSARIRSARYANEGMSSWAQQGRVFVQASHNLLHHS